MCGIAGYLGRDRDRVRATVTRMSDALAHRGPDADGIEVHPFGDMWLGIAQRRLAIIDLSPLGRQPMAHAATGSRIVFNGEIYNFPFLKAHLERDGERFASSSDTEVILAGVARHGPEFIRTLEGMYAFAHYDPRTPSLVLSRDPAGIKPLILAEADGGLLFASEVRSLLASGLVPKRICKPAVGAMLAYGSVPQPLTIVDGCRMMPPGSWLTIRANGNALTKSSPTIWWTPPKPVPTPPLPEVIGETKRQLTRAVKDHLIADVPVGVFLSAGLDSSIIAGLAARENPNVRTFTVGFADQPDFDEIGIAAETARRFGVPHEPIRIPAADAEAAAAAWFESADQPSMDGLNTFVISHAVRKHGIKVALCGLGGDELFGGYGTFRDIPRMLRMARRVNWLPRSVRRGLAGVASVGKSAVFRKKLTDMLSGAATVTRYTLQRRRCLSERDLSDLGISASALGLTDDWLDPATNLVEPADGDDLWTISALEATRYMTDVLLRDSDVNGLAHALEIRVPFLDQQLITYANSLPGPVRVPADKPGKFLLREAAADVLHPDLLARPKTGFTLPLRRWMTGPLKSNSEAGLSALKETGLVKTAGVDAIWHAFLAEPESPAWSRALTLVALGDFVRRTGLG
jgi:asparagine synthase (glutamine-hydrolysing)